MHIFNREVKDGLESKISYNSIAFVAELIPSSKGREIIMLPEPFAKAEIDDPDIYHVYSILVSTVWNKNDDIFTKECVWAARNTPRFKPANLDHDERKILGGIIDCWPVDENMNLISADTNIDDLPDVYHLLVSSVIYRKWKDPELQDRADKLIADIEAGNKFVSMECIFHGFDYGVLGKDGSKHVIARSEETSFLTKHLRAYGGPGVYQDHKVGRMLKNIVFSAKGFVDNPANPDSIIFKKDHIFSFANAHESDKSLFLSESGVNIITNTDENIDNNIKSDNTENDMSESLNKEIAELKATIAEMKAEHTVKVSAYESQVKTLTDAVAELEKKNSEVSSELVSANEKIVSLEKEVSDKTTSYDAVVAEMHKMKDEEKKKNRKEEMSKCGFTPEEIEAQYENFANLSDDQFKNIMETLAAKVKIAQAAKASSNDDTEKTDSTASDIVDSTSVEKETIIVDAHDDGKTSVKADLAKWVEERIMKKNK